MQVGIVGAGIAGLTAAYELGKAGHRVTIFEEADHAGGLASTFRDERWDWPLEHFYHHMFASDDVAIRFSREIGIGDKLLFPRPITAIWRNGTMHAFDSPLAVLRYPYLSFVDKMRVGMTTLYLRLTKNWQSLEEVTAHEWLTRYLGQKAYETLWEPLLANKMGRYYQQVPMSWFWARIHARTPRLGYYVGSYQTLIDALVQKVQSQGGAVHLNAGVSLVEPCSPRACLQTGGQRYDFDAVLVTASPKVMLQMAPMLPDDYSAQLRALKWVGALTMILALDRPMTKDFYWVNLPHGQFPFLAFVEHTNYQSPAHYGGDHIIYLGDYPADDQPHATMSREKLLQEFLPSLTKFNPSFDPSWMRKSWLFRTAYAQPVPPLNFSRQIPEVRTPLSGLYFASMSQVYPWDRGTNYAVEMGQKVARMVMEDGTGK